MQNDDCLFCKISRGEIPSKKIYEDEEVLPSTTLILPRLCIPYHSQAPHYVSR